RARLALGPHGRGHGRRRRDAGRHHGACGRQRPDRRRNGAVPGCTLMARGFTLVEVLVALSVFALLAAGGVAVMGWASASQGATQARMARVGELQRARAMLQADLSQAAPRRTRNAAGIGAVQAFTGSAEPASGLLFALTRRGWENPEGAPRASLQYVEYRLQDGRLERSARPMLDGAGLDRPQSVIEG